MLGFLWFLFLLSGEKKKESLFYESFGKKESEGKDGKNCKAICLYSVETISLLCREEVIG